MRIMGAYARRNMEDIDVIRSVIEVHEIFMESLRFQIDLVPPQYLVGKIFKSSRHSVVVSARSYIVIMGTWVPDLSSGFG